MDDIIMGLPDRTKAVIMHEAMAQAHAAIGMIQAAADKIKSDPDALTGAASDEAVNMAREFFDAVESADHNLLGNMFLYGFISGAGYLFRIMSLLDSMNTYINSDEPDFGDDDGGDDDDGRDRAGLPRHDPDLGCLSDDEIHNLMTSIGLWKGKGE